MGLWGPPLGIWATVATGQCCVGIADHVLSPTAEQCRDRARLIRYTAAAVKSALLRQDLLEMASEYEQLAESAEVSHSEG